MVGLAIAVLLTCSSVDAAAPYQWAQQQCGAAAERRFGRIALPPGERGLKRLKYVPPAFPPSSKKHPGTGGWRGVVLVGPDGKVKALWSFAEPEFTPPWPEGMAAINDAIKKWEYVPVLLNGEPQPVCFTVTVEIHWTAE